MTVASSIDIKQSVINAVAQGIVLVASIVSTAVYVIYSALYGLFLKTVFRSQYKDKDGNSIPDGPTGLPVVGSFPLLSSYPELTLDNWAQKFGPLYSMWMGNQLFVVVSDAQVVKDLFVSNGAIFSSRKENFIKSQTIFARRGITAMSYSEKWRKHRKIATTYLAPRAVDGLAHVIDREATELVRELFIHSKAGTVPINPQPHAGRAALNNMLAIVFGIRTDTINHPLVAQSLKISREFMNCTGPISNLTDFVPLLQHIPNTMTSRAKRLHQMLLTTYGGMMDDIEARMKRGEEVPESLVKNMVESREKEGLDWLDMTILCSAFMIGGIETTASLVQWFCALIPAYPEIQAKAHEELDRVVGRDRIPSFEDTKELHYIRAVIKEVERSRNPFWLGTPHQSTQDFTYRGQFIPKDTVLIMNTYTIHHNPERYPDPHTFNPERYVDDHTTSAESINLSDPMERDHFTFGAGRRVCPGTRYAEQEVFLAIARMLWAFKMEEIPEEPIDLTEYDGLSGRSPVAFRLNLTPRHERVAEVLGV